MTTNMQSLCDDARSAGYAVATDASGHTTILKQSGRWKKSRGLVIYADGSAVVAEIDLSVAKCVRSYKSMRAILEI